MDELASWSFGTWLQRRRQALHLTQHQLADLAGYSVATIRKLEGDQRRPSHDVARELARVLHIPDQERDLFLRFARGEAPEPPAAVPGTTPRSRPLLAPSNLPPPSSRLIGRESELQTVRALLEQDDVRLITLTGPGGVGKTRLALAVAEAFRCASFDGVYLIPLATVGEPSLLLPTIARVLEIREQSGQPLVATVRSYVRERRLLLVLDNFEQLVVAAPELAELLEGAPWLKLLVTSRIPLRLRAEREVWVAPLATPDRLDQAPDVLAQYAAVQMFLERAQAICTDPSASTTSMPVVATICARLDGLPLAIELATARLKVLPPEALLRRLGDQLALLTIGSRDLPPRQQPLRSTIAWSTHLLAPSEQMLFRRLGVFVGGWTLDVAEQVCVQEADAGGSVLDRLQTLVDASLVQSTQVRGEPRFTMLTTIREYALEQLDIWGEAERIRQAHALYFLDLAEAAEPQNQGPRHTLSLLGLEAERANLHAALGWSQEQPERAVLGARLAGALGWFWTMRGHFSEGGRWLDRMRTALVGQSEGSGVVHTKLLLEAGWMALYRNDFEQARSLLHQSLAHYRDLGDLYGTAFALLGLGRAAFYTGDQVTAAELEEESLPLFRRHGTSFGIAYALLSLGDIAISRGDVSHARQLLEESLLHLRELGDAELIGWTLINLGRAALTAGDLKQATLFFAETEQIFAAHSNRLGLAQVYLEQGRVAQAQGHDSQAGRLYRASLTSFVGYDIGCLVALAALAAASVGENGDGQGVRAARLLGAVKSFCERQDLSTQLLRSMTNDGLTSDVMRKMGEAAWTTAWCEGQAMTLEQAVAYALEVSDPD